MKDLTKSGVTSKNNALKIKLYNVGHGDCILITFPNGDLALIDSKIRTKEKNNPAYELIREKGSLKLLCLTHPHFDHYQGMYKLFLDDDIQIEKFIHSMDVSLQEQMKFHNEYTVFETTGIESVAKYAATREMQGNGKGDLLKLFDHVYNELDEKLYEEISERKWLKSIDGVDIAVLAPSVGKINKHKKRLNELIKGRIKTQDKIDIVDRSANSISAVIHLQYGGRKILLGGDALDSNWKEIVNEYCTSDYSFFPVDVIKASHHGASDSFYPKMWSKILSKDSFVLVSSGKNKHPSEEFVTSLKNHSCNVLCTNKGLYCMSEQRALNQLFVKQADKTDIIQKIEKICHDWIEISIPFDKNENIKVSTGKENHCLHCRTN